jgi:hypothetical protein
LPGRKAGPQKPSPVEGFGLGLLLSHVGFGSGTRYPISRDVDLESHQSEEMFWITKTVGRRRESADRGHERGPKK